MEAYVALKPVYVLFIIDVDFSNVEAVHPIGTNAPHTIGD